MGVYIEAMEMPNNGETITITICGDGIVFEEWKEPGSVFKAFPVPAHGDLIDRAELWVEINKICDRRDAGIITDLTCLQQILSALRHAPTIIPAEEGET